MTATSELRLVLNGKSRTGVAKTEIELRAIIDKIVKESAFCSLDTINPEKLGIT
jgi:hypothetical protein